MTFHDLLAQSEDHKLFMQSINGSVTPPVVFNAHSTKSQSNRDRGGRNFRGGRGHRRRPLHYHLCRTNGHFANACPQLVRYASPTPSSPSLRSDADLAQAFHAYCHVTSSGLHWYVDLGATDHMSSTTASVTHPTPFPRNDNVFFGNSTALPISHAGHTSFKGDIHLRDVLVILRLTKNLLSVSKLTHDNCMYVLFSHLHFYIHDRKTEHVLAQGQFSQGIYMLSIGPQALFKSTKVALKASFDFRHARLGHVSYDAISLLNKQGPLLVSSLLPNLSICSSCQMEKAHRLPFVNNDKRVMNVLDLIHCDLWGSSPVCSVDSYCYYVSFVDGFSRFTWFYPSKLSSILLMY